MAIDHTNCTHPRTPAGRRACRSAVARGTTLDMTPARSAEIDRQVAAFSDAFNTAKMVSRPAPKNVPAGHVVVPGLGVTVPRPQPKRRARKVADDGSGCVQAALHTGRGRCACSWDTMTCTRCGNTDSSCRPGYCHYALSN